MQFYVSLNVKAKSLFFIKVGLKNQVTILHLLNIRKIIVVKLSCVLYVKLRYIIVTDYY